jgi:flagellar export protein FliJ
MGFRFPLATVLRVKEIVEKRQEVALQKAQLEIARTGKRLQELDDQIATANSAVETELRKSVKANRLRVLQEEINVAKVLREALVEKLKTLELQRDVQMQQYQHAHREREMFTDLFQQQKSVYEREQVRVQQKRLDDIVAARWQRS